MCVITAPTLHNSGGSNEGTAAILAAAFWAASIEIGEPLSLSGQAIPADKALVIISNIFNFKTRASRDAPIDVL